MAGGEIGVGLRLARGLDRPAHADLPAEALPVEEKRGLGIGGKLAALGALAIGIEDEAALIGPFEQDHPHIRQAGGDRPWQRAIASGSAGSAASASAIQSRNRAKGSAASVKS